MTRSAALFVGDVGWDLTLQVDRVPEPDEKVHTNKACEAPGGVIGNAAVAAALAGAKVKALIACGDDPVGREIIARLSAHGIEIEAETRPGLTCRSVILIEPHGEKRLLLHPGVSMYPGADQARAVSLDSIGWAHTAVYDRTAAAIIVDRCRERRIPWSIDLEPATFADRVEELAPVLEGAAVVFCNGRAAAKLGADPASRLQALGVAAIVFTQGADGAMWRAGAFSRSIAAPRMNVVDTTGAGDCLAGWFIAETLRGAEPPAALAAAVAAATLSCGAPGAQASFPSRAAVDAILSRTQLAEPLAILKEQERLQ